MVRHEQLYELHGRYFDLYTRQHGLEQNLFLAPGEGDAAVSEEDSKSAESDPDLRDALRLVRGEIR